MATIEQRSGNWSVYWRLGGRGGVKQRVTFGPEKLAKRAKQIAEAHRHLITKAEVESIILGLNVEERKRKNELPTVAEWADIWLDSRTRISPGTRGRYRSQLDRIILPAIGGKHLDEVSGIDVVNVLNALVGRTGGPATPETKTRYFTTMFSLFKYAVREKKIDDNPAGRTDFIRDLLAHDDAGEDGDDHVYLTYDEFDLICARIAPAGRPVIELLAGTGARWSEATAVAVGHVKVPTKGKATVRIRRAWKQDEHGKWYLGPTKGRTKRTASLSPLTVPFVQPLLIDADGKPRDPEALLLTAPRGGRLSHSNFNTRYWEPAVDAAMRCAEHPPVAAADGGPARDERGRWRRGAVSTCDCGGRLRRRPTLHDLRHSFVAWLIKEGQPITAISQQIGHRTTEITELVYAGILVEVQEAMADAVFRGRRGSGG